MISKSRRLETIGFLVDKICPFPHIFPVIVRFHSYPAEKIRYGGINFFWLNTISWMGKYRTFPTEHKFYDELKHLNEI